MLNAAHLLDQLFRCSIPEPNSGCWIWDRSVNRGGYGVSSLGLKYGLSRSSRAHRLACFAVGKEIGEGMDVDHLCRVRCCVNPDHLEPVTRSVNLLRGHIRGHTHSRIRGDVRKCPYGHLMEGANIILAAGRYKKCRECHKARMKEYNALGVFKNAPSQTIRRVEVTNG